MKIKSSIFLVIILILSGFSCSKGDSFQEIKLPSSSILTERQSWAVCVSTHVRMRYRPDVNSDIINTVWKGAVVEIIARSINKSEINGVKDFWYKARYNTIIGWVFGTYVKFYSEYDSAVNASRGL